MHLLFDAGNTRIKWGALEEGELSETGELRGDHAFATLAGRLAPPATIRVASVRDDAFEAGLAETLHANWPGVPVRWPRTEAEAHGVTCAYANPTSMGVDRWLALLAARSMTSGPVCVVDAGSAVTLDAMDPIGRHLGGLILPGLAMARRLMHERTARVRVEESFSPAWWADNTSDAVNSGSFWAIVSLVERFHERTEVRLNADCEMIMTGGDAAFIMESLPERARHEPHLVLEGLALLVGDE